MIFIRALALTVQRLIRKLKFSKSRLTSNVKVTRSKVFVPTERSWLIDIKALARTVISKVNVFEK